MYALGPDNRDSAFIFQNEQCSSTGWLKNLSTFKNLLLNNSYGHLVCTTLLSLINYTYWVEHSTSLFWFKVSLCMCAKIFGLYLGHPQACQYKNLIKAVLTCLRVVWVRPKHVADIRATNLNKINLCFVGLNMCGLFSNKHKGMAFIKIATLNFFSRFRCFRVVHIVLYTFPVTEK